MNTKGLLGYILAVIIALLWACGLQCNEQKQPETERIEQSRNQDLKQEKVLEVKTDTFIRDRWRTKTQHDTFIKRVSEMDSTTVKMYFDSLVTSRDSAVKLFYHNRSNEKQLALMDSVHSVDTARISLLRNANLKCDTLLAEANKTSKNRWFNGFKAGFLTGAAIGTTSTIILSK